MVDENVPKETNGLKAWIGSSGIESREGRNPTSNKCHLSNNCKSFSSFFFRTHLTFFIAFVDPIGEKFALLEMTFKNFGQTLNLEINTSLSSIVIY